jgi:dolichol kinase
MKSALPLEFGRKSLHVLALIIPCGLYFFPEKIAMTLLLLTMSASVIVEMLRFRVSAVQDLFMKLFSPLLRQHEVRTFTGSTSLLVSSSLCAVILLQVNPGGNWLFPADARVALFYSFSFLILGDASAAVFGKLYGKKKIAGEKTYVGMSACFVTSLALYLIFRVFIQKDAPLPEALFCAGLTAGLEVLPIKLDDNLFVPPLSCFAVYFLLHYKVF